MSECIFFMDIMFTFGKCSFFASSNHDRFIRKEYEATVNCSLACLLSCRLRNGYTVNEVKMIHDETQARNHELFQALYYTTFLSHHKVVPPWRRSYFGSTLYL